MSTPKKISRNEKCPCGSGKKFKQCHGQKESPDTAWSKVAVVVIGVALAVGLGHGAWAMFNAPNANEGKVWNAEHGHFHNADGTEVGSAGATATGGGINVGGLTGGTAPAPQPPGPVPEGKVWSAEHGHWHDAP